MKISYKSAVVFLFIFYLVPVVLIGYLTRYRIGQRQISLQLFFKNQTDIDRQIANQRNLLRQIQPRLRSFLLLDSVVNSTESPIASVKADLEKFDKFWAKYEATFSGEQQPFLKEVLKNSQELNLIDEELASLQAISREKGEYLAAILAYPPFKGEKGYDRQDYAEFLQSLDKQREEIYSATDELMDIRYIFNQRTIFYISGENDKQQGFFNVIFVFLSFIILALLITEYFIFHKPFGDIINFLRDKKEGKRGQRLYFSSFIKEIKQSEEIINEIVSEAEEHEKER